MSNIVKITTIPNLFDIIAPHSCRGCGHIGSPLCDCCKKYIIKRHQNFCPNCKTQNIYGICQKCSNLPPTFVVDRRNSLIGTLAEDYKFLSNRSLANSLSDILDQIIPDIKGDVVIVPLPTNTKHIRERGLDHTFLLAKKLARLRGKNYSVQKLLSRAHNTTQVGTNKKQRRAQAEKAYSINLKITINSEKTYLLLDDIWTTGASMKSALKKLREAGASKVIIALLAVS